MAKKLKKQSPKDVEVDAKLQKALNDFPKIIKEEMRNFKARERDIKRFDKLSRELVRLAKKDRN